MDQPNDKCWVCGKPALILASYYHPHCSSPHCHGGFYDANVDNGEINAETAQRLGAEFTKNVAAIRRVAENIVYASEAGEKRPFAVGDRVRVNGYPGLAGDREILEAKTFPEHRKTFFLVEGSRTFWNPRFLKLIEAVEPGESKQRPLKVGDKVKVRGDGPMRSLDSVGKWITGRWNFEKEHIGAIAAIEEVCDCGKCGGFYLSELPRFLWHPDDLNLVERAE